MHTFAQSVARSFQIDQISGSTNRGIQKRYPIDAARKGFRQEPCCNATDAASTARRNNMCVWLVANPTLQNSTLKGISVAKEGNLRRCAPYVEWKRKPSPRWHCIWWSTPGTGHTGAHSVRKRTHLKVTCAGMWKASISTVYAPYKCLFVTYSRARCYLSLGCLTMASFSLTSKRWHFCQVNTWVLTRTKNIVCY